MNFFRFTISYARIFTLLVIVLPIVAGTYAYQSLPKEGEPEISAPIAIVITPYPGASPSEVESLVTNSMEEALSDLKNMKEMRSSSAEGVSVVVVEFDVNAELEVSMQKVREKVSDARGELPDDVEDSEVKEISLTDIPIMLVSVVGDMDPIKLKKLAENIADQIELIPEVLSTDVAGGLTREIQILLDPERLDQYGLTILDVYNAVKQSDISIPGGMVNVDKRRFLLRTLTEVKKIADYEKVPLIQNKDRVVFLGDVAEVVDGHSEDVSYSRVDGKSGVSISIKKRTGANILQTSEKVREKLKELKGKIPAGVRIVTTADQAKFIQQGFDIMNNSAVTGLIIVIFALYFAMGLRNSIITSFSIPLSLLFTFIFLKVFGLTNNNMVRFSLVLCIGLLVDNAIIVVENAYHHFQLGKDRLTAVIDGVSEISMPVIAATLTTMAAFLPMLLMTGTTGEYMSYLPKTVTIALVSSLIVALITSPLVLSRFMKQTVKKGKVVRPEEDLKRVKKVYVRAVSWALNHRFIIIVLIILSLTGAGSLVALKVVEIEMFPDIDFDFIYITVETPSGTDVETTKAVANQVERIVNEHVPEAVQVVSTVGYKGQSAFEITVGTGTHSNFAEITVELLDGKEFARTTHKAIQKRIRPLLDEIPGANIRYRALAWGPPRFAPIVVKVIGQDLAVLRKITADVKGVLSKVSGAIDIKDDFSDAPPELRVTVDRAQAASLGVPLDQVAMSLRGATAGLDVRDFRDELDISKKYELKVRYSPESRTSPTMLDRFKVRSFSQALVPLSNIARFTQGPGVNVIRHVDRRRVVKVTAQNEGRSAVEISKELNEKLASYVLPEGYVFDFSGDFKETEESFASLKLAYLIAFLIIFTLLVTQFNSYFQPFAIMTALPLSIVGAMIGLVVTGNNFSIMSFVGLVGLTGIVVNDSIVLVDCINRIRKKGLSMFDAIIAGGQQRIRPILSTTITTIGGIVTLTITDKLWEGLGVVIIFGIAFATVLTLVVVPVMYSLFEGFGYQVVSAVRGPRWLEAPEGRSFFFSRRRFARIKVVLILMVQVLVLVFGMYKLGPLFMETAYSTTLRAPTVLKLIIEGLVFGLGLGLRGLGVLLLLLIPTWIGLLYLMWQRTTESQFVGVSSKGITVALPTEKIFLSAAEINRVRYSGLTGRLIIYSGRRRVRIRKVVEEHKVPSKIPLKRWLSTPAPARTRIREGMKELQMAIKEVVAEQDK